jgi:oxygen-dependent protoporphyrinogen oxidase
MKSIAIIGGGITGLSAAYRTLELAPDSDVTIYEASDRVGGIINTVRDNGCIIECGPDSSLSIKPAAVLLARRLGIDDELISTNAEHRRALIVNDGVLKPLPEGFYLMAPGNEDTFRASGLLSPEGTERALNEATVTTGVSGADESLADFVRRRFGQELLDRIAQPMVGGIYTADPEKLSLRATIPRFQQWEEDYGSVTEGLRLMQTDRESQGTGVRYSAFVGFRNGMSTLIEALVDALPEGTVRLESQILDVAREGDAFSLHVSEDGDEYEAVHDAVLIACNAHHSSTLLSELLPEAASILANMEHSSAAATHLCWKRDDVPHPLDGFGYVSPAIEGRRALAGTFHTTKFPGRAPEGQVLIWTFFGGSLHAQDAELPDDALIEATRDEYKDLLGITAEPLWARADRWMFSMPQYNVGHQARAQAVKDLLATVPGLDLAGATFDGVGIPDCIASAESAVERLVSAWPDYSIAQS